MRKSNSGEITLNLPPHLLDQARAMAEARGTSLNEILTVALTGLVNYKIRRYDLDTPIQFTRYRGLALESVIRTDPSYVRWCVDNMKMELSDDAANLLKEIEDVSKVNMS